MAFGTYAPMVGQVCTMLPDPYKAICTAAVGVGGALDPADPEPPRLPPPPGYYPTAPAPLVPMPGTQFDPASFFVPPPMPPAAPIGDRVLIPALGTKPLSGADYATDYVGACPSTRGKKACIRYDDVAGFSTHLLMRGYVPAETPTGQTLRMQGHPLRRIKVCIIGAAGATRDFDVCVVPLKKPRKTFRLTRNRIKTSMRVMRALTSQQAIAGRLKNAAKCLKGPTKQKCRTCG